MLSIVIGLLGTILGVALGGAVRAWEAKRSREIEAAGLLSALVADVEALTRLMNHRRFAFQLLELHQHSTAMINDGKGDDIAPFAVIYLKQDYFALFDASLPKLGLLKPYAADRIVRFYTYLKAVMENYDPSSPWQGDHTANTIVKVLENDLQLLQTVLTIGDTVTAFRVAAPPAGMADPFSQLPNQGQPALPSSPADGASADAGAAPYSGEQK